ncbi:Outer membrane protein P6 [Pontiella desulfatans]|uniref:Peptidoglycan-associated lipoprotein n=1 Tax=Pontiella desulfatans TaxID=2750659 RepID=A0A6C2U7H1_PONDE|nr:OmpA family protein [Pontiella desulfatans]VGO15809.1 Outer membrane protein P6 [Pontiella desulfatans]
MKKMILKMFVFGVVAGSVAVLSGCQKNKAGADFYDSESNMYGDPLLGDTPLVDPTVADGDRSLFPPVFFAYDSSQVNPEESGKCEQVADYLKKGKGQGVIVEGHGDERGSREYNLALGERRALAVRDYLISLGVNSATIQTKTYGEEMPDDMGHDENAWRKNRRAVFAIY